jgi:hypothetical protein
LLALAKSHDSSYFTEELAEESAEVSAVGPHVMIVSAHPYQDEFRLLSHDGSNGMPYVAHLPKNTDLYLVMPFRQWDENELPEFWQFPSFCHSNLFVELCFQ